MSIGNYKAVVGPDLNRFGGAVWAKARLQVTEVGGKWQDYSCADYPWVILKEEGVNRIFFFFLNVNREEANGDEGLKTEKGIKVQAKPPNNVYLVIS